EREAVLSDAVKRRVTENVLNWCTKVRAVKRVKRARVVEAVVKGVVTHAVRRQRLRLVRRRAEYADHGNGVMGGCAGKTGSVVASVTVEWLRSTISPRADPCADFYSYVCASFRGLSQLTHTRLLVEWMISMDLDLSDERRLSRVDPVDMIVRCSLDLGSPGGAVL
ncbi:hypothetical protein MRX96_043032, partial [Rhipicephalus microplus]